MRVLFLFSRHSENPNDSTLTKDLADVFYKNGDDITVVTFLEKKYKRETELKKENGYDVLRIKTGNYFNVKNKFEKGMTILTIAHKLKKGILNYLGDKKFDLIITHTPFVSTEKLIKPLKKYYKCPAYLILWDIFPQNAKDIGLLKNEILFKYFKYNEKKMLSIYDKIWCMSKGNINYLKTNYLYLNEKKIKLLKNWAIIKPEIEINKELIRKKYGFLLSDYLAVFGGNMGKPQKLENILALAKKCLENKNIKFIFIGNGSEKERLIDIVIKYKIKNVYFIEQVPRDDYEKIVVACDIGIVSLDERFTVPNFPSKTTDYFKLSLPILASLDNCSIDDYGKFIIEEAKAGVVARAGNIDDLYNKFIELYKSPSLREKLGKNGRSYYENNLGVENAYKIIMEEFKNEYI